MLPASEACQIEPRTTELARKLVVPGAALLLRGAREQLVQSRLATIGGIAMDDPTFGRLIDRGDQQMDMIGIRLV